MKKKNKTVFLDTVFLIALHNPKSTFHKLAKDFHRYFTSDKEHEMVLSSIALAEYCVKGQLSDLSLSKYRVSNFTAYHAQTAGMFCSVLHAARKSGEIEGARNIVPNDSKLLAQAKCDIVDYYLTFDHRKQKMMDKLKANYDIPFDFVDLTKVKSLNSWLGKLELDVD